MPRPQVKDLFERIGRPQIKPQASTETYGYSQPAATSRSNDLTQLGGLMKEFSEAASDWADVLIKKEVKEGEEEGRIRALSDKRKGLQTLIENSNNLVKDGKLPHGLNWFAVKAYHRNAGALFAQDRTTANILNEGVSEWMADKISNEDLTFPQLRQQLYSDVVLPRLNELRDQLPNSRMARNIGFDESIQPVLDKLNERWEKDYEAQVYEKNLDTFSQLVTSKLREGNFDEALELFSPNLDTTDYPLGTGLDPRTNKRAVMFGLFKNYIENDLISSNSLGDYKLKEIDDATDSLKAFMQKREKGSNAKVGDYNVIGEGTSTRPYHNLLRELKRQRRITVDNLEAENLALSKEAQIQFADALLANQEFFIDRFERQYEGTVVLPKSGEENLGIKDANAKVPVGEVNAGLNMRAVKINKMADASAYYVRDPKLFATIFVQALQEGELKKLNGDTYTADDFGMPIKDLLETKGITDSIIKTMNEVEKRVDNIAKNEEHAAAELKIELEKNEAEIYNLLISTVLADKKWDEAEFKQAFGHLKGLLENESARKAGIFINPNEVYSRFLRDAKEDFSQSFMDFNAEGSRAMYEAVAANIDKLMEVDSFRRRQMIMLDDEFASVDKSEKEKILSLLENNYASVFRLSSFYSNEGSMLLRDMRGATYAGDGNFQAAIEEVKDKPVNYDASVTIYGRTIAESKFIDIQRRYLDSIGWNQIVKDVHEHYNFDGKRARQKLEEIVRSKSEQPIVLPAFGDKPELKLMDSSPANEMRKQLKNDGFDSWFDWLTDWRKRVEESKTALGNQPTE